MWEGDGGALEKPRRSILEKGVGPLEMQILDIVWTMGSGTSREVFERMRDRRALGQSTVLTVLRRLTDRGILDRNPGGDGYIYSARIGRAELGGCMIDNLIDVVFRGAIEPVVDHLARRAE